MLFLLALIPATGLTVAGYVALYISSRSEGSLKTFGRYLGIWAFVLAGLVVLGGMFAAGHMHRMHEGMWGGPHCPFMERRDDDRMWERHDRMEGAGEPARPAVPPAAPAAAQPNPPPAAK